MLKSSELWPFSCELYTKTGVEEACLALQNKFGWNIPLLLYCIWSGLHQPVDKQQLITTKYFVDMYSGKLIEPLRHLRTSMKQDYEETWPVAKVDWFNLREDVKTLELNSERSLLESLGQQVQMSTGKVQPNAITYILDHISHCYRLEEGCRPFIVTLLTVIFTDELLHSIEDVLLLY